MGRAEDKILKYEIKTRVNEFRFNKLTELLTQSQCQNMSELVRHILNNRPVTLLHRDKSLDLLIEELSGIRKELRSIGVNINQVTRYFNAASEKEQKLFYALSVAEQYQSVTKKVEQLLNVVSKISEQWSPK